MWVKPGKLLPIHIKMFDIASCVNHNLMCWLCDKQPAVYNVYPNFIFLPCWKCQKINIGWWSKKKKRWYEFWK